MTDISDLREMKPRITVFGVGGAGGNAVNNMITAGLQGVDFVVANTDAQALAMSKAARIIQMGMWVTEGLGAGSRPEVGRAAAEEVIEEIRDHLSGAHMVFVTAGMGGGTGTGAATVIAKAAQELGILTIGVVTKPFHFEGQRRMRLAEAGILELQKVVDTLLIIPNQNLFRVANEKTTFADAFAMADRVLYSGVACITDLIVKEGLINLDFADVRAVMREKGKAMMGMGEASGANRVLTAAETAISNPLIEDPSIKRASGLLISITGGNDLTLFEVDEAATRIREEADQDANIIIGATFDDSLEGIVRVSVVATGIDNTGVARQLQQQEGALANLAEKLRHDGRRIAERTQQEASFRPMPITPSLLGLAQTEPSIASAVSMTPAADHMSRTPRMPRIDAPLPTQNEIRAAQRKERDDHRPEKRHMTLMQRLASIGLGRRAEEDEPKGANAASRTLDPRNSSVHSSVSTTREYPHSFPHNLIDEDALDSPAFLRRRAN
jgi:cell division protein FtsZ